MYDMAAEVDAVAVLGATGWTHEKKPDAAHKATETKRR